MNKKGSFSYLNDSVNYMELDANLTIRIEKININAARVYLVDAGQVQQPIPPHVTMQTATGVAIGPFMNNFIITWADSYTLFVHGQPYMYLNQQKKQSILGPAGAESGLVG